MQIAVYEDDRAFAGRLDAMIRQAGEPVAINTAGKESLLRFMEQATPPALFFLDIVGEEDTASGFELADQISHAQSDHLIVFLTGHMHLIARNTPYKVIAFNTIEKDTETTAREVGETIELAREVFASRCVFIRSGRRETLYIPYNSIYYIEHIKRSNRVRIHCEDGEYIARETISGLMERLDGRFVRCHNSFLVNRKKIRRVIRETHTVEFPDGSQCAYSFLRRGELEL